MNPTAHANALPLPLHASNQIDSFDLKVVGDLLGPISDRLPPLLPALSDAAGCVETLQNYLKANAKRPDVAMALLEHPERLEKLLAAFDLGSQPRQWLISGQAVLSDNATIDSVAHFETVFAALIAPIFAQDSGRSTQAASLAVVKRTLTIDLALQHYNHANSIDFVQRCCSLMAEQIVQFLYQRCLDPLLEKYGSPIRENANPAKASILTFEDLGAWQLLPQTPLSLMIIADLDGKTQSKRTIPNRQFFERLAHDLNDALACVAGGSSKALPLYKIHWHKANPNLESRLVCDRDETLRRYDQSGRTWQRQEFISLRSIAGHLETGASFIKLLQPWIYRRYVTQADRAGVDVLKRKIVRQLHGKDLLRWDTSNPEHGMSLIVWTVQLLQLSGENEDDTGAVANTSESISRLYSSKRVSKEQATRLHNALNTFASLQMAMTLDPNPPKQGRMFHWRQIITLCFENIKPVLLSVLVGDGKALTAYTVESELILDPLPPKAWVAHILQHYKFNDPQIAYEYLRRMSEEEVPILSTRNCRQQFATIVPRLLNAVKHTPSPIATLHNLNQVTQSLGGKRVLWQLFENDKATEQAMLRLCAGSPYLTNILTQMPGMLDELIDSLLLGRLPLPTEIADTLAKWIQNDQQSKLLPEFKLAMHLRIGIRDILNKSQTEETHQSLTAVADAIVIQIAREFDWNRSGNVSEHGTVTPEPKFALFAVGQYGLKQIGYRGKLKIMVVHSNDLVEKSRLQDRQHCDRFSQYLINQLRKSNLADPMYEAAVGCSSAAFSSSLSTDESEFKAALLSDRMSLADRLCLAPIRLLYGDKDVAERVTQAVHFSNHPLDNIIWEEYFEEQVDRLESSNENINLTKPLFSTATKLRCFARLKQFEHVIADALNKIAKLRLLSDLTIKSQKHDYNSDPDARRRLSYLAQSDDYTRLLEDPSFAASTLRTVWQKMAADSNV